MKNMKLTSIMIKFIMIPLLFTTSCVNEISEDPVDIPGEIPIRLSTQILCNHTRAINNEFQEKDAIGLYVLTQLSTINQKRYIDNMRFTCSQATGFQPEETIYYPKGDGKCDFISYYPFQETGINQDQSIMQVQIHTDQSSVSKHSLSDFMIATNSDITPSQNMVSMEYKHKLCKLKITIKPAPGEDIDELLNDNPSLSLNGFHSDASYDFLTDRFEPSGQTISVTPHGEWKIENNALTGKEVILIPEEIESDNHYINIDINGKSYSCPFPDNFQLASEKNCSIAIIYKSSEGIQINNFDHSITDWTEGDSGETTAQETSGVIHLSALKFSKSNVYKAINEGTQVAEICKEYLLADNIDAQAIVVYPVLNGATDLNNGTVICLLDEPASIHGGKVSWNKVNNALDYTPGEQNIINDFYITEDKSISISKPENPLLIRLQEDVLTDIRSTETKSYPIVKIGTQYWIGRSLEATRYTDGSSINEIKDYQMNLPGYFTYNNKYFYTYPAIETGYLSTIGWKIPNQKEWDSLKDYLKNKASNLKSGSWKLIEKGDNYDALNKSYFNGIPEGYFINYEKTKGYAMKDAGVGYWVSQNKSDPETKGGVYLLNTNDEIREGTTADRAISVRCIRK
ncbi:fimbrillin family protein [Bacteroides fragilis]|uniref:fimbrillin family protein n=1 Tax=Bacteroides fragilis TaxID=817 RepID=UPI003F220B80